MQLHCSIVIVSSCLSFIAELSRVSQFVTVSSILVHSTCLVLSHKLPMSLHRLQSLQTKVHRTVFPQNLDIMCRPSATCIAWSQWFLVFQDFTECKHIHLSSFFLLVLFFDNVTLFIAGHDFFNLAVVAGNQHLNSFVVFCILIQDLLDNLCSHLLSIFDIVQKRDANKFILGFQQLHDRCWPVFFSRHKEDHVGSRGGGRKDVQFIVE